MSNISRNLPLEGVKVLDLCDGIGDGCGRYLADLGAEVLLIEPPKGSSARQQAPVIEGQSAYFATHAANKKSVVLNIAIEKDKDTFKTLSEQADILIHSRSEAALLWLEQIATLTQSPSPTLVVLSISDFGDDGPYAGYSSSNAVHLAMAGVTARSGLKGREPLLPPGQLAYEAASIQAAWVALLGFWQRLQTGKAGAIDFSVFEATCQMLDPALGVTGSGAGGQSAVKLAPRGRAPAGKLYPFFPCADGHVRLCILNPRQWYAMSEWLGKDHPFTDPSFGKLGVRYKHMGEINQLIEDLFLQINAEQLVVEGQQRGVPIAAVASPQQVLKNAHFQARGAFVDVELAPGLKGLAPAGFVEINGKRASIRDAAPELGKHLPQFSENQQSYPAAENLAGEKQHPFNGIRVLDLGVIVAGAELGRLFADQGAQVIKIENKAYPDGLRQSLNQSPMTESFAQGTRGKKSLGLNLRSEDGKNLFKKLVAKSDIILSNFKPGTMESLGFGYDDLKEINPKIIVSESSALGSSGPMSKSMGYGPLVRASTSLTGLWRYPDDETGFGDALTIFPDHVAARASAVGILSLLIERERTGQGGTVSLSQAETILMTLSTELLTESLKPEWLTPCGNRGRFDAPASLFPCAGDDEWCAIEINGDAQWQQLCEIIDRKDLTNDERLQSSIGRLKHVDEVEKAVAGWTCEKTPMEVTAALQAHQIAAGKMLRINELPEDRHLTARNFFRTLQQPGLPGELLTENGPAGRSFLPDPDLKPAPFVAQHTRELVEEILQLDTEQIDQLIESGDLEIADESAS